MLKKAIKHYILLNKHKFKFFKKDSLFQFKCLTISKHTSAYKMNNSALIGVWSGLLQLKTTELLLTFHFIYVNSYFKGYLDVPAQLVKKLPFDDINFSTSTTYLNFSIKSLNAKYNGNFEENFTKLNGIFEQNGAKFDLSLYKTKNESEYNFNRPQTPLRPFNYYEEEVKIENKNANVTLMGTLTYPNNRKPLGLVILAHGSGGHDRDETIYDHKPFMVIADHLTKNNIAVLRYDERGIAKSTGSFAQANDRDFADDLLSAINFIHQHPTVGCSRIGVIGHSKGAATCLIASSMSKLIKFIVMLGGQGLTGEEILYLQNRLISQSQNQSSELIEKLQNVNYAIYQIVKNEPDNAKVKEKVAKFLDDLIASSQSAEDKQLYSNLKVSLINTVATYTTPWFRDFLVFDPKLILSETTSTPLLALWGSLDLQVPGTENYKAVKQALDIAGNKNYRLDIVDGLNHLFQHTKTGNPDEYSTIEETFAIEVLDILSEWLINVLSPSSCMGK